MDKCYYVKYFTIEQINNMKASEHRRIKDAEYSLQKAVLLTMGSGFFTIISIIALIIWMSKAALFIFIVNILVTCIIALLWYNTCRSYIKAVNKVKERLS